MLEGSCHCGAVRWTFDSTPESATACNCTICRRYGALWIYGHEGEDVSVSGPVTEYVRGDGNIGFRFCPACGCVVAWRGREPGKDGRRRLAVNLRMSEPGAVAHLPIDHFDGLETWSDLPRDGRCVSEMWF